MIMTTVTVYDPPMCCSSGVCGPEIDPKLVQFAGDLDWLKSLGVEIKRHNLAQEPARFVDHAAVKAILDRTGGDDLPAIVVGDVLVVSGRYPARDELAAMAGLGTETAPIEMTEQIKELIALGAAISAGCEPCFKFHYDKARKLGISDAAMREAVKIGEAVKAAAANHLLGLAGRLLGSEKPKAASSSCCGSPAKTPEGEAKAKSCC
jgi:AhpD family alkylhydroperoxidase